MSWTETVITTGRGEVVTRLYQASGAAAAALLVGGVGGGFDTPARNLYPRMAASLVEHRVASLRVRFRHPRGARRSTLWCSPGCYGTSRAPPVDEAL